MLQMLTTEHQLPATSTCSTNCFPTPLIVSFSTKFADSMRRLSASMASVGRWCCFATLSPTRMIALWGESLSKYSSRSSRVRFAVSGYRKYTTGMNTRLKMANTGHLSIASLCSGGLGIHTDVELVTKVSNADRCELGAHESEYPVRGDGSGCTSTWKVSSRQRLDHSGAVVCLPCAHC